MGNSLNKEFTVKITRAVPENETGVYTEVFRCGNIPYNNTNENISGNLYRGEVNIQEAGGVFKDTCDIAIYGLSLDKLNAITFTWWDSIKKVDPRNTVEVIVEGVTVFIGNTYFVRADFSNAPDICLRITGVVGTYISSIRPPNETYESIKIAEVFKLLGNKAGMGVLISPEIDGICPKITLSGSLLDRILKLGKELDLNVSVSCNFIRVGKHGEPLPEFTNSNALPVTKISKDNGMIGYPTFNEFGVNFSALFDPYLRTGQVVEIESIVPKVNGQYIVIAKNSLLSTLPNGQWRSNYVTTSLKVRGNK